MRTVKNWIVVQDWPPGFRSPRHNIMVRSRRGTHVLAAGFGTDDDVGVYRDGDSFYVLSMRRAFPYVGLALFSAPPTHKRPTEADLDPSAPRCYKLSPTEPTRDLFAQGSEQVTDCLGHHRMLENLAPITIAKRLAEWLS